jgi:hypothetical protein
VEMSEPDPGSQRAHSARQTAMLKEASHLLKRVRQGNLSWDNLDLAAMLGYRPAIEALGEDAPPIEEDLKRWVRALDEFGHEVCARITCALAWHLLPILEEDGLGTGPLRGGIEASEAWLACPCEQHATAALDLYPQAIAAAINCTSDASETAALIAAFAAYASTNRTPNSDIAADAADITSEARVRDVIRKALLDWALREDQQSDEGETPFT